MHLALLGDNMKYTNWKLLTESFDGSFNLGIKKPNVVGGLMGRHTDMEDEDMDDIDDMEDEDMDDEDMDDEDMDDEDMDDMDDEDMEDMDDEDMEDMDDEDMEDMDDEDMDDEDMDDEDMDDMEDMDDEDMDDMEDMDDEDMEDMDDEDMEDEDMDDMEDEVSFMNKDYCGKGMGVEESCCNKKMSKKFMKKDGTKKHQKCESDDFISSLISQMTNKKTVSEDSLFTPVEEPFNDEAKPGDVGFAPQGKIGSIGGGYTKKDFADIPVLGESFKFPTLTEWQANRS